MSVWLQSKYPQHVSSSPREVWVDALSKKGDIIGKFIDSSNQSIVDKFHLLVGADSNYFEINNNNLVFNVNADYELKTSFNINLYEEDSYGVFSYSYKINLNDPIKKTYTGNFRDYGFKNKGDSQYYIVEAKNQIYNGPESKWKPRPFEEYVGTVLVKYSNDYKDFNVLNKLRTVFDQLTGLDDISLEKYNYYNKAFGKFKDSNSIGMWIEKYTSLVSNDKENAILCLQSDSFAISQGLELSGKDIDFSTGSLAVKGLSINTMGINEWGKTVFNLGSDWMTIMYELLCGLAVSSENSSSSSLQSSQDLIGNSTIGISPLNSTEDKQISSELEDKITGISTLVFDDNEINITDDIKGVFDQVTGLNTDSGKMFRLYNAALNRFPDVDGLKYWIEKYSSGENDDRAVASSFLLSSEFKERYGENTTNSRYVEVLYDNVLGRDYDQAGYEYWLGNLNNGIETRYELLLGFSESAENKWIFSDMTGFW